jgi:hypothetical protein
MIIRQTLIVPSVLIHKQLVITEVMYSLFVCVDIYA